MKAPLSASQLLNQKHFFSKTSDRVYMKCHTNFWFLRDKKVMQPGINLILRKKSEISLKVEIFGVGKKIVSFVPFHFPVCSCLYDSAETACFREISFLSYIRKCSESIRLEDFLSFTLTKTIWSVKFLFECS